MERIYSELVPLQMHVDTTLISNYNCLCFHLYQRLGHCAVNPTIRDAMSCRSNSVATAVVTGSTHQCHVLAGPNKTEL